MRSIDTETTGLWFTHGCTTFAIGIHDGSDTLISTVGIEPLTRKRSKEFDKQTIEATREIIFSEDITTFHNAHFDLKALVEAKVLDINEPSDASFWDTILDTHILAHLHHNTDKRSLKSLMPQYFDRPYLSEERLDEIVNKCRTFIRSRRPNWKIASSKIPSLRPAATTTKWNKCDMWLPAAVAKEYKSIRNTNELTDYGFDINELESVLTTYLEADCINSYDLAAFLMDEVISMYGADAEEMINTNNQIRHVTWKMEVAGTPIHSAELKRAIEVCEYWINTLTKLSEEMVDVKHITDTKLRRILYEYYKLPSFKETSTGAASVDADSILKLKEYCIENASTDSSLTDANKFLSYILALKKYSKKHGYLVSYQKCSLKGFVYPNYNICGTDTVRMSASNPSPQTVAKASNPFEDEFEDVAELLADAPALRSVFGPHDGYWWLCNDYSQLQLRIFAVATDEQDMIEAFDKGWDAHDYTARRIFGLRSNVSPTSAQRRIAKNVNFGFIFGASPKKIEKTAGMVGLWDTVCEMFPNAHAFIEQQKDILKSGDYVRTLGGYPLDVPMRDVKWKVEQEKAAHAAVCYIVQGTEGEIVKRAMRLCDDYLTRNYPAGRLVMQVHDEISFNMPARFPKQHAIALKECMEEAALQFKVKAPVNSELVTKYWNKGKELSI